MNRFIVYYSRANDSGQFVTSCRQRAESRADETNKQLSTSEVDIDSESDLPFWSGNGTIECVAVADDEVVDRERNPPHPRIDNMVDQLP